MATLVGVVLLVASGRPAGAAHFAAVAGPALASAGLGVLVATRRAGNRVGVLLGVVGVAAVWEGLGEVYATVAGTGVLPESRLLLALLAGDWMFLYVPPAVLMLCFPDGALLGRRWRWVVAGLLVVAPVYAVAESFDPGPFRDVAGPPVVPGEPYRAVVVVLANGLPFVFLGLLAACAAAMVVRYRRGAEPVVRARLKWFALGALSLPATLLSCWVSYLVFGDTRVVWFGLAVMFLAIPAATAVAVLRHDLYDVDKALSAAVTYGLVTAVLLGVYTVVSSVAGLRAGGATPLGAAVATAVCAALLAPLRRGLQRRVDRRVYPARSAALAAIDDLRRRTHVGTARPEELEGVLRSVLRDEHLRVVYRLPGRDGLFDADGRVVEPVPERLVPVRLGGEDIGGLVGGAAGRDLLVEVAAAGALVVEVVRLRSEVSRALAEVRAGQTRLLHAEYRERRRLERDLHDGAQQRLVALGATLRVAQRHLTDGAVDVDGLLDRSVAELATAVGELRRIAHGLRPSSLDDGLEYALTRLADGLPIATEVVVCAADLPDDVATAVYYIAGEAVTNAVKHARATAITVGVTRSAGRVTIRVGDDGVGGAEERPGAGLVGLTDRVRAAGGTLLLSSPHGAGTVVEAVLPCGS
ncbi:histidine kinase [Actinosynnema sp. NPDC020468]|uniref:sensor histidine kinase n=1 Tax=Actinosynnema sp. NPDC020468 TaxID=3154488 RepID=UPI0034063906